MLRFKLKDKRIGEGQPCFIIADIGANHNRRIATAKKLINEAAAAGASAVKFQIYSSETLYSKKVPQHSCYKKNLWELIKDIETPREWIPKLKAHCDKKNIIFFATPFDHKAVDELDPYVDLYKIASFELVDLPLIKYIAKKKKPIIISTGLATMEEVEDAYKTCNKAGNKKIAFLQCASVYPAKPKIMNLKAMGTLRKVFNVPVGLSDHTSGIHISTAAVAIGANFIEKHFTLDRTMKGPDHSFAIEPNELKTMVRDIRDVESSMGNGQKQGPTLDEIENYRIGRRSLHAKNFISRGTIITENMLAVKRPGFGIKPKHMGIVVGRKARRDIKPDEWITWKVI